MEIKPNYTLVPYEEAADSMELNDFSGTPVPYEKKPDFIQRANAMFATENSLASYMQMIDADRPITTKELEDFAYGEFNPLEYVKGTTLDDLTLGSRVIQARSPHEVEILQRNVDREENNRRVISQMSLPESFLIGALSGVTSPEVWPIALILPHVTGATLLTRALKGGAVATADIGVSEMVLHKTQAKRTLEESVYNMSGAFVLGGILSGSFAAKFTPEEIGLATKSIEDYMEAVGPRIKGGGTGIGAGFDDPLIRQYVSPKIVKDLDAKLDSGELSRNLYELEMYQALDDATSLKRPWILAPFKMAHPGLRLALSRSPRMRAYASQLFEDAYSRNYMDNGMGPMEQPITSAIHHSQEAKGNLVIYDALESAYEAYVGLANKGIERGLMRGVHQRVLAGRQGLMSFTDFDRELVRALISGESEVPGIMKAATRIRADVIERVGRDLGLEEGKAKPHLGDNEFYPRTFDVGEVNMNHALFQVTVVEGFENALRRMDPEAYHNAIEVLGEVDMYDAVAELADAYRLSILRSPTGMVATQGVTIGEKHTLGEFFNGKIVDVDSLSLLDNNFIYGNTRSGLGAWLRNVVPKAELTKRFGNDDLADVVAEIREDMAMVIEAKTQAKFKDKYVAPGPDMETGLEDQIAFRKKLQAPFEAELRTFDSLHRYLLHKYERPDDPMGFANKTIDAVKSVNVLGMLGGMMPASFSDLGTMIIRKGLAPFGKTMAKAVIKMGKGIPTDEALKMGNGMDIINSSRMNQLGMLDEFESNWGFQRGLTNATTGFSKATGMASWNAELKQLAGLMTSDELGSLAKKADLSPKEVQRLSRMGINKENWKLIKKQILTHQSDETSWNIPHTDKWTDPHAVEVYERGVVRESDTAIVTPGPGDLPLAAYNKPGSMFFQFKTFMFAFNNKVFLPSMQAPDANAMVGLGSMVFLGMASKYFKAVAAGGPIQERMEAMTTEQWIDEGIAHSGVLGLLYGVDMSVHALSQGNVSMHNMVGLDVPSSRYGAQSVVSRLVGPWYGTANNAASAASVGLTSIAGGEVKDSDIAATRRLIPFNNLFYIRRAFDQLEKAVGSERYD